MSRQNRAEEPTPVPCALGCAPANRLSQKGREPHRLPQARACSDKASRSGAELACPGRRSQHVGSQEKISDHDTASTTKSTQCAWPRNRAQPDETRTNFFFLTQAEQSPKREMRKPAHDPRESFMARMPALGNYRDPQKDRDPHWGTGMEMVRERERKKCEKISPLDTWTLRFVSSLDCQVLTAASCPFPFFIGCPPCASPFPITLS